MNPLENDSADTKCTNRTVNQILEIYGGSCAERVKLRFLIQFYNIKKKE